MDKTKIIIAAIIGVCFTLAFVFMGRYIYESRQVDKTVSVIGLAEEDFTSDLIVWDLSFSSQDMNQKTAYAEIKNQSKIVKEFLTSKGIDAKETLFKAINTNKEYDYYYDKDAERSFSKFAGYKITQSVRIESSDVEKVEEAYLEISELLDKGVDVDASSPDYYYTKLSDLKIEMLAKASEDARTRAETIVKNAGGKIQGLQSANMGVFQITAPNSSDEDYSWGGTFNTSSKAKRASINMRLTYLLK
ncbi:MAG: SIMPL domain-containing protein [Bacteroidales bacterium]|nr:SIMPL domain-containing protein [Bacteroidales bacterium]